MLKKAVFMLNYSLKSRIERKYCFIRTSYLAGLFHIFIFIFDTTVGVLVTFYHLVMLIINNLILISTQSWTYDTLTFLQNGAFLVQSALLGWLGG